MCFLSIPHTVVGLVYIFWPLLTGGCFKQVILYRLSATGTSCSDHNSQVAALNIDQYRQVPFYIIHAATHHPHIYSVPHIFTSSHPHTHSLTTHTLSSHRHMNRYPPCGKNSSHCARNWMDPLLTLLCELFVTMTTVSTERYWQIMWTDQALLGHARMSSHFSDISCLKNIWAFKHSDPFKCSPGSHSVG